MKRTVLSLSLLAFFHAGYSQNTADTAATTTNPPSVEVAGIKITGSVDVYYRYNFANAKDTPATRSQIITPALLIRKTHLNWVWRVFRLRIVLEKPVLLLI